MKEADGLKKLINRCKFSEAFTNRTSTKDQGARGSVTTKHYGTSVAERSQEQAD